MKINLVSTDKYMRKVVFTIDLNEWVEIERMVCIKDYIIAKNLLPTSQADGLVVKS